MTVMTAPALKKTKACVPSVYEGKVADNAVSKSAVAWVLLVAYCLLMFVAVFGLWLVAVNFGSEVEHSPKPPGTSQPSQTTPSPYSNPYLNYGHKHDYSVLRKMPSIEYKSFVSATYRYANYGLDPKLYVVLPCGACCLAAGIVILGGLFTRKIFATTASLHTSSVLWLLTLVTTLVYNANANKISNERDSFLLASAWVIGVHAALLLLLSLQMVVSMWELRRQKTGWPSLQLCQLFTLGAMLLLARMTLVVYLTISFYKSWMIYGVPDYNTNLGYWSSFVVRYPEPYVLPCATACAYGTSVVIQDILSHLMGPLNNPLRACTAMICALLYVGLAVVSSPLFVKVVIGSYYVSPALMILAILTSILTFLQAILCLVVPDILRETPEVFRVLARNISGDMSSVGGPKQQSSTLVTVEDAASGAQTKKLLGKNLAQHFFLLVPACVAVLLAVSGDWNSTRHSWGSVAMLCGDAVVLGRILPALVVELVASVHHKASLCLQISYLMVECTLLLIGSVTTFCVDRSILRTAAAAVNLTLGCYLLNKVSKIKIKKSATTSTSTSTTASTSTTTDSSAISNRTTKGKIKCEDEEPLTEAGPEDAQQHD